MFPILQPHTSTLPNCEPLHRDLQVSWEIFGPAITLEVAGRVGKPIFSYRNLRFFREFQI